MELHEWLALPENKGKATWLAQQVGRTKAAVSFWRDEGVPLHLIPRVVELSEGACTAEAMLQHALRCASRREAAKVV